MYVCIWASDLVPILGRWVASVCTNILNLFRHLHSRLSGTELIVLKVQAQI